MRQLRSSRLPADGTSRLAADGTSRLAADGTSAVARGVYGPTFRRLLNGQASRVGIAHLLLCVAGLVLLAGCATYHVGNWSLYPQHIKTVYVPMFESTSYRRNLGERLTEAVIKEIEAKTPYKVVGTPNADSVLTGQIVSETKRVLVENRFDDPREVQVDLQVEVSWIDHRGDLIRQADTIPLPAELILVGGSASLIPEVGQSVATAHQQAIGRLAEQIVAMMETPW